MAHWRLTHSSSMFVRTGSYPGRRKIVEVFSVGVPLRVLASGRTTSHAFHKNCCGPRLRHKMQYDIALTAGYMILLLFRIHPTKSCLTSPFGAPRLSILMQVPPAPLRMFFAGCRIVCLRSLVASLTSLGHCLASSALGDPSGHRKMSSPAPAAIVASQFAVTDMPTFYAELLQRFRTRGNPFQFPCFA